MGYTSAAHCRLEKSKLLQVHLYTNQSCHSSTLDRPLQLQIALQPLRALPYHLIIHQYRPVQTLVPSTIRSVINGSKLHHHLPTPSMHPHQHSQIHPVNLYLYPMIGKYPRYHVGKRVHRTILDRAKGEDWRGRNGFIHQKGSFTMPCRGRTIIQKREI